MKKILIALKMIFPMRESGFAESPAGEPFIVSLSIPLVAGPSTLTTLLIFVTREPLLRPRWLAALFAAWAASSVILVFAFKLSRFLGERGLIAVERLMGMILTTISVQMFLCGIKQFLAG